MAEPLTIISFSLTAANRVTQAFLTIRKLQTGWKLTQSFGEDYFTIWRDFQILCARLEACSVQNLSWLKKEINPSSENDEMTQAILRQLQNLQIHFQKCNELMKKYDDLGDLTSKESENPQGTSGKNSIGEDGQREKLVDTDEENKVEETTEHADSTSSADRRDDSKTQDPQVSHPPAVPETVGSAKSRVEMRADREKIEADPNKKKTKQIGLAFLKVPSLKHFSKKKRVVSRQPVSSESSAVSSSAASEVGGYISGQSGSFDQTPPTSVTSIRSPSAPAFSPSIVQKAIEADKTKATDLQTSTSFFKRAYHWAAADQKKFKDTVAEIRVGVEGLERLLEYKLPQRTESVIGTVSSSSNRSGLRNVQRALQRLHETLASRSSRKHPLYMTIKLEHEDSLKRNAKQLRNQEGHLSFRDSCFLFVLKVHLGDHSTPAVEFAAETMQVIAEHDSAPIGREFELEEISDLRGMLENVEIDEEEEEGWKAAGAVWRSGTPSDIHRVFYNTQTRYSVSSDLRDVISHPDIRRKIKPRQRVQLCKLIALGLLYFANVRETCQMQAVSPLAFRYYEQFDETEKQQKWPNDILTPYYSIGFGAKAAKVDIGIQPGLIEKQFYPIAELGLLLFQIASGEPVEYGNLSNEDLQEARYMASERLSLVDKEFGAEFSEVVELCLISKENSSRSPEEELDTIEGVIAWLQRWLDEFDRPGY